MTKGRLYKVSREADLHAGQYAYSGRKRRKQDLRQLWIQRIKAGLSTTNLSYSQFINRLKKAKIELDRKILADLVVSEPNVFKTLLTKIAK